MLGIDGAPDLRDRGDPDPPRDGGVAGGEPRELSAEEAGEGAGEGGEEDLPDGIGAGEVGGAVDRLSRSLIDFSKIMEVLERHKVSFVSVRGPCRTDSPLARAEERGLRRGTGPLR